ncbi:hypothetical protein [Streptomyces sp. NPDC047070]|uniref:hypothetical protein n=1 Tax=Streptomyces sp. NPDC047070 TaxID=3154923 RepID=UPI0034555418
MSRHLQHKLHTAIVTAAATLDLPLTDGHIEALAVELTPAVKAIVAPLNATIDELSPAPYTLAEAADGADRIVSEYAGCTLSIHPDVAEDSPAALLGLELRSTQPDVLALDVATATHLAVTVRPRSTEAWSWWSNKFEATPTRDAEQGCCTTLAGTFGEVTVELRGDGVPELLAQHSADRLSNVLAGHPW